MPSKISDSIYTQCYGVSRILIKQILAAQFTGFLLLFVPSILLGNPLRSLYYVSFIVLFFTSAYFVIVFIDKIGRFLSLDNVFDFINRAVDPVTRLNRIRLHLGWLVAIDTVVIFAVIGCSGGIAHSHLTFVLLLIPTILGFIKSTGFTLKIITIGIIFATAFEVIGFILGNRSFIISYYFGHLLQDTFSFFIALPMGDATNSFPGYIYATGIGLIFAVILAYFQARLSSFQSVPDRIMRKATEFVANIVDIPQYASDLRIQVEKAFSRVSGVVALTNEPNIHCSEVHSLSSLIKQTIVLATPGLPNLAQCNKAAAMVIATHWLDDMFDHLPYAQKMLGSVDLNTATIYDIGKACSPIGIDRVIREIFSGEGEMPSSFTPLFIEKYRPGKMALRLG